MSRRDELQKEAETLLGELGRPAADFADLSRAKLEDLVAGLQKEASERKGATGGQQGTLDTQDTDAARAAAERDAAEADRLKAEEAAASAAEAERVKAEEAAEAARRETEDRALAERARGLPLPPGHKRPTVAEYVKRGYQAANYARAMDTWENTVRIRFAEETRANQPALVDGAGDGAVGGPPVPRKAKRQPPNVPYYVAPGKSTMVRATVVGPLTPVKASDFERGQTDLDYLVARGVVIRTGA